MGFPENEVAADNQRRELEKLHCAPGGKIVKAFQTTVSLVPGAGHIANAIGLSKILMEMGVSTTEENLDYLGDAVQQAFSRVEKTLAEQGVTVDELVSRFQSPQFEESVEAVVLHSLHTRQRSRLKKMALILANSFAQATPNPEEVDDFSRAVVELTDWDIRILDDVRTCEAQTTHASGSLFMWWQEYWKSFEAKNPNKVFRDAAAALARLQAFGFIFGAEGTALADSPVSVLYRLSRDGERFLAAIQEQVADLLTISERE